MITKNLFYFILFGLSSLQSASLKGGKATFQKASYITAGLIAPILTKYISGVLHKIVHMAIELKSTHMGAGL